MKRLLPLLALLLVSACGAGSENSGTPTSEPGSQPSSPTTTTASAAPATGPERAVESLMRALDRGDCRAVRRLVVTPSAIDCDDVGGAEGSFADEGIDLDESVFRSGAVEGTSSTVAITWGNGYPKESYDVERVDGRWLVVFDSVA